MRLGQLSRKLEVESSTIVKVLKEHFREVNNHPNVKILDEELEFLTQKFAPKVPAKESVQVVEDLPLPEKVETIKEVAEPKKDTPVFVESLRPKVITLESEFDEKKKALESFKAEKPELEGLRVLGKIDLPEPKPKTPKTEKEENKKEDNTVNERILRNRNNRKGQKTRVNRTPAEERKRAEQLAQRKKAQEEKKLKEFKRKHYEENVKAKIADKPKRKKKKKLVQKFEAAANPHKQNSPAQKSTNPLVRFWKWLNGDYDKLK